MRLFCDVRTADHVEILVPAQAEVQSQAAGDFPVVLEVEAELLGGDQEVRIAVGMVMPVTAPGVAKPCGYVSGIAEDGAGVGGEVDLQRGAELEEAAFHRVLDVIDADL